MALDGLTVTLMGVIVTVALDVFVGSTTLVAVTVTNCWLPMLVGAVYRPVPEIVPMFGLRDHVTDVLEVPVTVAVNCWL